MIIVILMFNNNAPQGQHEGALPGMTARRMETVRSPGSAGTHTQPEPQTNSQANITPIRHIATV